SFATSSITFTAPTDAAPGEVSANDFVVVRIGTNASGGANRIVNPTTAQLAQVLLGGTFQDTALMGIPIVANDSVTVSATVFSTSTPSSGGGGVGDVVAPVIVNVASVNVTEETATVTWDTNELATTEITYGTDESLLVASSYTLASSDGLRYRLAASTDPVTVVVPGYSLGHSVNLTGLEPDTLYYFRLVARDGSGNVAMSEGHSFTTLGTAPSLVVSNVQVQNITDISALVTWSTNVLADSVVQYGTTAAYGAVAMDPGLVTSHAMLLTGLLPGTTYHFSVSSMDASNDVVSSPDATFVTLTDQTPPANLITFSADGDVGVIHLTWVMPADPDLAGVRIVRRTDAFPTGPTDGTFIYEGVGTAVDDSNVVAGVTYYYGAFAYDTFGNFASGALAQATPLAPPPTPEDTEAACSNGADDDGDGLIDCQDPECATLGICAPPPVPVPENTNVACSNGADDDGDGLIDCQDPECAGLNVCLVEPPPVEPPPTEPPPVEPPPTEPIVPVVPEPTAGGGFITINPAFYGSNGTIQLIPDTSGTFGAPAGSTVFVSVPLSGLGVSPDRAYMTVGGQTYNLTLSSDGTSFVGTFVAPPSGSSSVVVTMTFQGGGTAVTNNTVLVLGGGQVVEEGVLGTSVTGVEGAIVMLYVQEDGAWEVWNAAPYGQANPQITGPDGTFSFIVPNGRYYAEVLKDGYLGAVSAPITVNRNVFGDRVGLVKRPLYPLEGETLADVASGLLSQGAFTATIVRTFLQQPAVQGAIGDTISPALIGVSLVNIASTLPLFNVLAYLQYLFTQPILLLWRRRKKKWGIIYNSLTKQPVDLAIVRLRDPKTQLILQTKVTDKYGRYSFISKQGAYVLEVVKPGYVFPTQYLKDKETDVDYTDLYHGTRILAEVSGYIVAVNIPVDPVVPVEAPRKVLWKKTLRIFQKNIALFSLIASVIAFAIVPNVQVAIIVLIQAAIYFLFRRLAAPVRARDWGVILDDDTKRPIGRVIVRIFDKKFNKLLETQVTDGDGKYGFFVRRNVYYVTAEREGYERFTSPDIDLSDKDEAIVDQSISLKKFKN
ncbi:fibronectin type III domain-containing protein, partial [Candidatus Uhrbacteria bacterium]|nr:fibronectin type III domain-containing protein [Candidatus Uhrbacteria bacterium]